jgi:hypothetical protein
VESKRKDDGSSSKLPNNLSPPTSPSKLSRMKKKNSPFSSSSSYSSSSISSPFRRTFGRDFADWKSTGMPESPQMINRTLTRRYPSPAAVHTPAAAKTNALTTDLLTITNGLQQKVVTATEEFQEPHGSPEHKFKQDLLKKIAYLIERFHQVAQVSTTLEKRVHDLQAYCTELEEQLEQKHNQQQQQEEQQCLKERHQQEDQQQKDGPQQEDRTQQSIPMTPLSTSKIPLSVNSNSNQAFMSLKHANAVLRAQLANVHDQLDEKEETFKNTSTSLRKLAERIEVGESYLKKMHSMMGQMGEALKNEHALRLQAEESIQEMGRAYREELGRLHSMVSTTKDKKRRRRSFFSRMGVAHYSADEAENDSDDDEGNEMNRRSATPMAQYDGAFSNMQHFDVYLKKLEARRINRDQEREAAREKKKNNSMQNEQQNIVSNSLEFNKPKKSKFHSSSPSSVKRVRRAISEAPPAVKSRIIGVNNIDAKEARKRQTQSHDKSMVSTTDKNRVCFRGSQTIDPQIQQIDEYKNINSASNDINVNGTSVYSADDPILPRERTPTNKDNRGKVIVERSLSPIVTTNTDNDTDLMKTPPLRTGGWANLDVLDQVRDLHEHGVSMLERMNETSSEASSEGRRRAEKDANKLENQVDLLTRQYRDLLNSVSPPVVLVDKRDTT